MLKKAVVVSTGVVSMAVVLKLSQPVIQDILTSKLPHLWHIALTWLQSPYLYLLINCIILSIVASYKLQPRGIDSPSPENYLPLEERPSAADVGGGGVGQPVEVVFGNVEGGGGDEVVVSTPEKEKVGCFEVSPAEKPPISARLGHRRSVKASPEGKTLLKVSRPKKQETLDSTWRTITEGRPMPLTRHLKKSDTFTSASQDASPVRVMKKSDTFSGNSSPATGSGGKLRRESSLCHDELNRRVEAFIKKFNEEMRLQRQESLHQYKEMVTHGINLKF